MVLRGDIVSDVHTVIFWSGVVTKWTASPALPEITGIVPACATTTDAQH